MTAMECERAVRGRASMARFLWALLALLFSGPGIKGADPQAPGHVVNISTRGQVGLGDDVMIAGFVIVGESPRAVLVRVLGPSLAEFGVKGELPDPALRVYEGGNAVPVAENDDWGDGDPEAVIATGFEPYHPQDCALVLNLDPGLYTAVVSGRDNATGVALVEVYDLDYPVVVGSAPVKGDKDVAPDTRSVTVSFDRPMAPEMDVAADAAWGASSYWWSADGRAVTLTRLSAATPLPGGTTVAITLNPDPGSRRLRDLHGNPLAMQTLTFTVAGTASGPVVVATTPEVGAAVRADLSEIAFVFSEPMNTSASGGSSMGWWPYTTRWSDDGRTMYVTRTSTTPLSGEILFRIEPPYYRSASGVPLASAYELRFHVAVDLQRFEADPAKGFQWPYYLFVPLTINEPATVLVEPNNTGTWGDNPALHESSAESLVKNKAAFATTLGCPLLVPAFPRPMYPQAPESGGIYTHALDRFCLLMTGTPIERIDRQLIAMVDDARARLAAQGIHADERFFMTGFSASGAFTMRFAILNPGRLKAAAAGSGGGWPIAPLASWNGTVLRYPIGTADLADLISSPPDITRFVQLPLFIYVGSVDTNDGLDLRGMTEAERTAIRSLLNVGTDPYIANRWILAKEIYQSAGSVADVRIYPGVGHSYSAEIINDLLAFFAAHR